MIKYKLKKIRILQASKSQVLFAVDVMLTFKKGEQVATTLLILKDVDTAGGVPDKKILKRFKLDVKIRVDAFFGNVYECLLTRCITANNEKCVCSFLEGVQNA